MEKERPKWPLKRLKSMYFAMHCWKCKRFELPMEEYKQKCEDNIQKIIDNLDIKEMKFKAILFLMVIFLPSCASLNPLQQIKVYNADHRLTGVNVSYDLPLIWFSTNKNYNIILIEKTSTENNRKNI